MLAIYSLLNVETLTVQLNSTQSIFIALTVRVQLQLQLQYVYKRSKKVETNKL